MSPFLVLGKCARRRCGGVIGRGALAAVVAAFVGASLMAAPAVAAPGDEGAATGAGAGGQASDVGGSADAFSSRFITCPVSTDLERRLLGNPGEPLADASLCVFLDGAAFAGDGALDGKSRPFLLLSAFLKRAAIQDDRVVAFRIVDAVSNGIPINVVQGRVDALEIACKRLGSEAGYKEVRVTQTFHGGDFDWDTYVTNVKARVQREPRQGRDSAENDRIHVYAVHTLLERLLTNVDCVVDILPIVQDIDGARFPEDFAAGMKELIAPLKFDGQREMLVCIQYRQDAEGGLRKWVNDVEGRKAFAKKLGFDFCNVQQSAAGD